MAEGVHHGHMLEDFFLVCEFCEIYGPRTVLTIPSAVASPNNNELFNLEEFLLNIMTTDYQNFPGDKWETIADVSCIRTNVLPNLHTILHYFTLKDPNARGSVRPSCVAYITANQVKLYRWKREVMKVLSIAAQLFKQANMQWMQYNGHTVEIPDDQNICKLLNKWCSASTILYTNGVKQQPWTKLCPSAIQLVVSGLLQLQRTINLSLKDHILKHLEISSSLELFDCVLSEDIEFSSIIKSC